MPYTKINWQNGEAGGTPLNATNLNKMDAQIDANTTAIATNTADIAEIKRNTEFNLTSASPLNGCYASSIVGIDVDGCSTQAISPNIFDFIGASWTDDSGVSHSVSGNTITVVNSLSGNNRIGTNISGIDSAKTYTLSFDSNIASSGGSNIGWVGCNKVKSYSVGHNSFQFSGITTAYFSIYAPSNSTLKISNIMLEEGSTEHSYMPYTGTPTPTNPISIVDASGDVIAHTVNLFTTNKTTETNNGITATKNNDGSIALSGTATANTTLFVTTMTLKSGTYTFSGAEDGSTSTYYIQIADNPITRELVAVSTPKQYTFTEDTSITFRIRVLSGKTVNATIYPQIEYGTTATDYIAYASNKITLPTLRSVGTVKDELIVNSDGGSKNVLVGKKTISVSLTANQVSYIAFEQMSNAYGRIALMCDKFEAKLGGSNTIYMASDYARLVITSATDFSGDITVYYPLATPTTTTLTASEVSAIRALQTYSGTTIVDSALDVQSVTYHADTKQYIDEVDAKNNYSYTDTIVGKWADGKDLHRMVISATTPSSANTDTDLLTISNANIKRIDGIVTTSSGNEVPINYFYNTTYYIATWVKNGALRMRVGTLYNSAPCEIIVEYTLKNESAISVLSDDYGMGNIDVSDNVGTVVAEG